jgi:hypothetical protein
MGAEAALAVLDADEESPPSVICIDGNQIVKKPLMECVERVLYLIKLKKNSNMLSQKIFLHASFCIVLDCCSSRTVGAIHKRK